MKLLIPTCHQLGYLVLNQSTLPCRQQFFALRTSDIHLDVSLITGLLIKILASLIVLRLYSLQLFLFSIKSIVDGTLCPLQYHWVGYQQVVGTVKGRVQEY